MMPRSVREMTGISGSGTWLSQSQTSCRLACVSVAIFASPRSAGIGALQVLHIGEDVAKMLRVHAALTALVGEGRLRDDQRSLVQHFKHALLPAGLQVRRIGNEAARGDLRVLLVRDEHLTSVGPKGVQRVLHPAVALGRTIAKTDHEVRGPLKMVGNLLGGLLCDLGDARVRGSREAFQEIE